MSAGHHALMLLEGWGLPLSLFGAGLIGGFTHCTGMCGPFVLAQATARLDRLGEAGLSEWRRLTGAALLPYHLGRATTYVALGALAGGFAETVVTLTGFRWLLAAALLLAALWFLAPLASGLGRLWPGPGGGGALGRLGERLAHLAAPLSRDPRGFRGYGLGVALGFLPCGLLYGALAAAAGSGTALQGAAAMGGFVVGTIPGLLAVGYLGAVLGQRWQRQLRPAAAVLMAINAVILVTLAYRAIA